MCIIYLYFILSAREKKGSEKYTSITQITVSTRKSSFVADINYKRHYFEKLVEYKRGEYICPFCQKINMFPILTEFLDEIERSLEMEKNLHLVNKFYKMLRNQEIEV